MAAAIFVTVTVTVHTCTECGQKRHATIPARPAPKRSPIMPKTGATPQESQEQQKKKQKVLDKLDAGKAVKEASKILKSARGLGSELKPTATALRALIASVKQLDAHEALDALVAIVDAVTSVAAPPKYREYHLNPMFACLFMYSPMNDFEIFCLGRELRDALVEVAEECDDEVLLEKLDFDECEARAEAEESNPITQGMAPDDADQMADVEEYVENEIHAALKFAIEEKWCAPFCIDDYGFGDRSEDES